MDTTTRREIEKQAQLAKILKGFASLSTVPSSLLKSYLAWAAALGVTAGAATGTASAYIKSDNKKTLALDRKKKFYDRKIEEMENENWLNDLITIRKKLESTKTQPAERKELEKKYLALLDK